MGRAIESPYLKGIPMQNITIGRYKPHERTLDEVHLRRMRWF